MNKTFLDECFKTRMDYLQKRFPIESFRRLFKQQYVRNGLVMIQPIVNKDMDGVIIADSEAGFIRTGLRTLGNVDRTKKKKPVNLDI